MTQTILVRTGARLHFGFLSCKPESGRHFGGAGLMIDSPGFEIAVHGAERFTYCGPGSWRERVQTLVERLSSSRPVAVDVVTEVPAHTGLGSGTQLAMALASAVARLAGEKPHAETLSDRVSRGARSALGIHGFALGGFLVDAGKMPEQGIGTLAARVEFPADWRILLATPRREAGIAGSVEREAFVKLPSMPRETTDRLCGILLRELLPAVAEADFDRFGDAVYRFGRTVGEYFAPVQGGAYAHPLMRQFVDFVRENGVSGVGQTSWGPTIFAFCRTETEAGDLFQRIEGAGTFNSCDLRVVAPRNRGAEVIIRTD